MGEFFSNFNWIDIAIVVILVRVVYTGMNSNLLIELFGLISSLFAVFVVSHYYARFADFLHEMVFIPDMVNEAFAIIILWLSVHVVFKLITAGWSMVLKVEAHPVFDRWGGFIFSLGRSVLVCGLLFVLFIVAGNDYLRQMSARSWTGKILIDTAPAVYSGIYDGFIVKYFPDEPFNEQVLELRDMIEPKEKKNKVARH